MNPLAFIGLVEKTLGLTDKLITDGQAQRSTEERQERIGQANEILQKPDSDDRAGELNSFVNKLCIDAGQIAAGDLSRTIAIPLSHFTAMIEAITEKIKNDRDLAAAEMKLRND